MTFAMSLNRRVVIQQEGASQDEAGQPVIAWTNVHAPGDGSIAANILKPTGAQMVKSDAPVSVVKVSIRIRYEMWKKLAVDAGMRAVHGDTIYDIKAVLPDEVARQHADLVCETGANNG
jgi:SPP1 family predicted phage head-tail adaptor